MKETFEYYNHHAQEFIEGTLHTDMRKVRERFLKHLGETAHILDAGCGSGRDSLAFLEKGHTVTAIDGSEELCKRASELIGQPVKHQYFEDIEEIEQYDGIWACATLLHVPGHTIKQTLEQIIRSLKIGGVFYMSFKYGEFEGMRNGRYFTDYTEEKLEMLLGEYKHIQIVDKWITEDARPDRDEKWINIIIKKIV